MILTTHPQFSPKNRGPRIAAILAVMAVAGCSTTNTTVVPPAPTSTSPAPSSPRASVTTFGDGTYTVGQTVKPGTYRSTGPGTLCYWKRLKGFSGKSSDIIANNFAGGPGVVTIEPTDKGFQSADCGTWTSDLSRITTSMTSFGPGTYIVKTDITPGTYHASGGETCSWERLSGFGGSPGETIADDSPKGSVTVTVQSSDKGFESTGCGTFTKS